MDSTLVPICGFDNNGSVFDSGTEILRQVHAGYREQAIGVFNLYNSHNLNEFGIVPTKIDLDREFLFRHKKLVTTYPSEWPAAMLRDAASFHLKLYIDLSKLALTLKDGLPNNIVFEGSVPCFVDFLSLVPCGQLDTEEWLVELALPGEDLRTTILRTMLIPYFLIPLFAMALERTSLGRAMLRNQACNVVDDRPSLLQILRAGIGFRQIPRFLRFISAARNAVGVDPQDAYSKLLKLVDSIKFNQFGGYADYYSAKDEDLPFDDLSSWRPKQLSVAAALDLFKPNRVIDLGSNTGWFSRLAESKGASVISVDIDEPSLTCLYNRAKLHSLNITPVCIPFGEFTSETVVERTRNKGEIIFKSPIKRLRSEVVLALGLIHHLILGEGRSIDEVISILKKLSSKGVILEFVSFEDRLISGNPGYFPKIADFSPETYNLERIIEVARNYFSSCTLHDSHPDTRKILVLSH